MSAGLGEIILDDLRKTWSQQALSAVGVPQGGGGEGRGAEQSPLQTLGGRRMED